MVIQVIEIYNGDMPILELFWPCALLVLRILVNLPFFVYFRYFLLQFVLGFEFICRFQISLDFYESGFLSRTSVGVWFWVVGHLSLGLNLLAVFSHVIDY